MSYRYMRVVLFYDLPQVTNTEKRFYRKFHRYIESEGFIQLQESVYSKLVLNSSVSKALCDRVKKQVNGQGSIVLLHITEKQFSQMEFICGKRKSSHVDSDKRLIIL